jgi:hypothetical protein
VDFPVGALPTAPEDASRWRRAALIAGGVAALELIVLVVVALAFVAKPFAHSDASSKPKPAATTAAATAASDREAKAKGTPGHKKKAAAELPRGKTGVVVLNGNGEYGAAAQKAIVVRSLEYPVVNTGDARNRDFPRTIIMYRNGFAAEGYRLAHDLGLARARAVPLDGLRPSELGGAKLALIVGRAA